ncbi:hypothetical protein KRX54_00120 [Actinomycetaceae bacterium TAE3-ERU4]|nr:hypothetical protein [Actinomycetaceae bacterium TAE3-ERU4]
MGREMSKDCEYFVDLVTSVDSLSSHALREEILSRPVDFWSPSYCWEWKQSNSKKFAHFIVLAIRSLDGTESDEIVTALVDNLHIVVPWCVENVAELSMLLIEEFIEKKIAQVNSLLQYVESGFCEHPDFSDRKQALFDELTRYRGAVDGLKFNYLSENWLDEINK